MQSCLLRNLSNKGPPPQPPPSAPKFPSLFTRDLFAFAQHLPLCMNDPLNASIETINFMGIGDRDPPGSNRSRQQEAQPSIEGDLNSDTGAGSTSKEAASEYAVQHPRESSPEYRQCPPLPPRPTNRSLLQESLPSTHGTSQRPRTASRPQLLSAATTAVSRTDINTQSFQDGSRETFAAISPTPPHEKSPRNYGSIKMDKSKGPGRSEGGDSASVRSYAPTLETGGYAGKPHRSCSGRGARGPYMEVVWQSYGGSCAIRSIVV